MQFATISNASVTADLLSYALIDNRESNGVELVWAEFPPTFHKTISAIWAQLVNNTDSSLKLTDGNSGKSWHIRPLKRAYQRFTADCPNLSKTKEGQQKFVRLVHPDAGRVDGPHGFTILDRFEHTPAQLLAATLENHTATPMMIGWGAYMLAAAQALGPEYCEKLSTGSAYPVEGYWFSSKINWKDIVATGVEKGFLTLEGNCFLPAEIPALQTVAA